MFVFNFFMIISSFFSSTVVDKIVQLMIPYF